MPRAFAARARSLVWLRRCVAGRRRAPGAVPVLLRTDAVAHARRRDEISARLGEPMTKDSIAQAWRTALDPDGEWIGSVLAAADTRLSEVRRTVPDAGGLVIATRPGHRARLRRTAAGDHGRAGRRRALRRRRGLEADRGVWRGRAAVDGRGADGVRGRRRAPARGGCVRHRGLDAAVLRAGDRTVRAGAQAGGDRVDLPAVGAGAARAGGRDGGRARPRAGPAALRGC